MPYTGRSYYAEVASRLERHYSVTNIDVGMVEAAINLARLDVQNATLQVTPERYARIHVPAGAPAFSAALSARVLEYDPATLGALPRIIRVGTYNLPEDFITDVTVSISNEEGNWQARPVSKRELYSTLTFTNTRPTPSSPIYCIDRQTGATNYRLLVSAGDTLPVSDSVTIWYLAKLPWLQTITGGGLTTDTETRIPYGMEELVVLIAMSKILQSTGIVEAFPRVEHSIDLALAALERQYEGDIDRSLLLTQARERVIPNRPIIPKVQ